MVARHDKSLMAFRRWAGTPAHLRHSLVVADNRLSTIARASVLQSQRFLVLQELSNGQVTHEPAAEKAFSLSQSLHFAGRDSLFQFTERSVEEEEQMIKTANILAELQIIKDSKPKAETDPLQYRQKVQARARNALSENQDSINKNRKFLESCRVNNAVI
jgi:hypothetical protein